VAGAAPGECQLSGLKAPSAPRNVGSSSPSSIAIIFG
jgi:hypothetical protein